MGEWCESEQQRNKHEHKEKKRLNSCTELYSCCQVHSWVIWTHTRQEVRGKADEAEADVHGQAEVGVGRWLGAYSRWR